MIFVTEGELIDFISAANTKLSMYTIKKRNDGRYFISGLATEEYILEIMYLGDVYELVHYDWDTYDVARDHTYYKDFNDLFRHLKTCPEEFPKMAIEEVVLEKFFSSISATRFEFNGDEIECYNTDNKCVFKVEYIGNTPENGNAYKITTEHTGSEIVYGYKHLFQKLFND